MGSASIDGFYFHINPLAVSWTYKVKSSVTNTVGGKVIQIYGTELGPMTINGTFGRGVISPYGYQSPELARAQLDDAVRRWGLKQSSSRYPTPLTFLYPERGWNFKVNLVDVSPMVDDPQQAIINFTLSLAIVEDNANLKQAAADVFIARMGQGIGWKFSDYNGPSNYDNVTSVLQGMTLKEYLATKYNPTILLLDNPSANGTGNGNGSTAPFGQAPGPGQEPNVDGMSDDDIVSTLMFCHRAVESGGDYSARNPSSTASGAYQFLDSSWGNYGGYARAWQAPADVQDRKAREFIGGHWQASKPSVRKAIQMHFYPAKAGQEDYVPPGANGGNTLGSYTDKVLAHWGEGKVTGGF